MLSLLLSLCGPVGAEFFLPALPQNIVIEETCISVSLTTPANTVFINVTEYDAQQIVKNITVEFREPVAYVSFTLDVLSDKPPYEGIPSNETVLQYYTIRFSTALADKITSVTMVFAVEKAVAQERDGEVTLVLYQYDGGKIEECLTEKVEEDDTFLYFKTETEGASYVAVTQVLMPAPWWLAVVIIATIVLATVIGIYAYRRGKLANLTKLMRTWHGK
jgi:PGF-pre-PGF domain-containing protein